MADTSFSGVILERLEKAGMKAAFVSVRHLDELKREIEGRLEEGELDKAFYTERLSRFRFSPPESMQDAETIIIVAVPQPQIRVSFVVDGTARSVLIPPTYSEESGDLLEPVLPAFIRASGFRLEGARLPEKLLCVRSGLARYGKNNVTYIEGLGSFFQLNVYFSNAPCERDDWTDAKVLDACGTCKACMKACPTGAIGSDRFLIRAEKCLTHLNERSGDFPEWVDPAWHNCIVGCMKCQLCCPKDHLFRDRIEDREGFSAEETRLILAGAPSESLPKPMTDRLEKLGLIGYLPFLPRNLSAVLRSARTAFRSR